MRSSNRAKILDAAVSLIHREGVTAVTFDSVAAECDLTRGGIMYHFPSRDDLLLAIHQHVADQWVEALVRAAGGCADDATTDERFAAYVQVCAQSASRAELLLALEAETHPERKAPWITIQERWTPSPFENQDDHQALDRFVARLAADGLWMYNYLSGEPLPPEVRTTVAERIALMISAPEQAGDLDGRERAELNRLRAEFAQLREALEVLSRAAQYVSRDSAS